MKELNNRLAAEITKMRSMTSEDGGDVVMHSKELYELEVCITVTSKPLSKHPGTEILTFLLLFTGHVKSERVRSAVPEAGDKLFKR